MKVNIQTPGFKVKQSLLKYLNEKVGKLACFCGEIIASEVSLRRKIHAQKRINCVKSGWP